MTSPLGDMTPIKDVLGKMAPAADKAPGNELGKDAFLKLLVAQLKYQDPTSPMQGTEFIAQTAQFTTVEKLNDLAETEDKLLATQRLVGASTLIGKTVDFIIPGGASGYGVATSAKFGSDGATLRINDTDVPLTSVTGIRATSS
jgi:flagellar basal-body rod modification protein FlgD